jgi:adenosylhomocysteine nucleosidase
MKIVVLISAEAEWRSLKKFLPTTEYAETPFGEQCTSVFNDQAYHFVQSGWGKISASASTQYVIDTLHPNLIINLGTCGGFEGYSKQGETIIATKTVVYDIIEKMGDPIEALRAYTTTLETDWLQDVPHDMQKGILVSADRDVVSEDLKQLAQHQAVAADWESGAIAWTAKRNNTPVIIARGVSDMVSEHEAEAFNNLTAFEEGTERVMKRLLAQLPHLVGQWKAAQA